MSGYYVYPNGEVHHLNFTPSNSDGKRVSNAEGKRLRKAYVCKELRKILRGSRKAKGYRPTVYTILRSVSSSGMSRRISCVIANRNARYPIRDITQLVADVIGYTCKDGLLTVSGCGMDAGFHVVYNLGCVLWPKGTPKPHGTRNGEPDTAGGYALNHEWL